jgi:hypothetical protein
METKTQFENRLEIVRNASFRHLFRWYRLITVDFAGVREIIIVSIGVPYLEEGGILRKYLEKVRGPLSENDLQIAVRMLQWFGTHIGFGRITGAVWRGSQNYPQIVRDKWHDPEAGESRRDILLYMNNKLVGNPLVGGSQRIEGEVYKITDRNVAIADSVIDWILTEDGQEYVKAIRGWEQYYDPSDIKPNEAYGLTGE